MDVYNISGSLHGKENPQRTKVLQESKASNSPMRTPLGDMRNRMPATGYAYNIRKTLYGTPTSAMTKIPTSVKAKTSLSELRSKNKSQGNSSSNENTPKRQMSAKRSNVSRLDQSSKRPKVVRFSLGDDWKTEPDGQLHTNIVDKCGNPESEEEKLDKEIEGFITSIIKLTIQEFKQEREIQPTNDMETPTFNATSGEDKPTTFDKQAEQISIVSLFGDACQSPLQTSEPTAYSPHSSARSHIPVRCSKLCFDSSKSPSLHTNEQAKMSPSSGKVGQVKESEIASQVDVNVDGQIVQYSTPTHTVLPVLFPLSSEQKDRDINYAKLSTKESSPMVSRKTICPLSVTESTAAMKANNSASVISIDAAVVAIDSLTPQKNIQTSPTNPEIATMAMSLHTSCSDEVCDTVTPVMENNMTPAIKKTVTPVPEITVTPVMEKMVTPVPEITVTPVMENNMTPALKKTVTPVREITVTPVMEKTVTPVPEITVTPVMEKMVTPALKKTVTPVREITVTPVMEKTVTPVTKMIDTSMITDTVDMVSRCMMAKPECGDQVTMTDIINTKTTETSMTPMRTLTKAGKRLTADEIRRQHPRVIANQLDTTQVCNERLKTDLKHAEKDRDKLKLVVKDLRASLASKTKQVDELEARRENEKSEIEEMHFGVVRDFQLQLEEKQHLIEMLEAEVCRMKTLIVESETGYQSFKTALEERSLELQSRLEQEEKAHQRKVEDLEQYYESNNYKGQFERSQQLVQELQAQLDEFADLLADLEYTEQLQEEAHHSISDAHIKLRHAGVRNAELRKKIIAEYVSTQKMKRDLLNDIDSYKVENEYLREDCESMTVSVELTLENMVQLQSLYASTSNNLLQATSHVQQLNQELAGARKAIQDLVLSKDILVNHLVDKTEDEEENVKMIDNLNAKLTQIETDLKVEQNRRQYHEQIKEDYDLCIANLQRKLEYRDQDIDILEKDLYECREIIQEQRYSMDERDKKHAAFKESVVIQQVDQTELQTLRDHAELLEAERGMLINSIHDIEEEVRSSSTQLKKQQEVLMETQNQFVQFQDTIENLKEELSNCKEELSSTQCHARRLLLKQGLEMRECAQAITAMEQKMYAILAILKKKVGIETDGDAGEELTPPQSSLNAESLVSKVLHAVDTSQADASQANSSFAWSKSRPRNSEEASSCVGDSTSKITATSPPARSPGEASRWRLGYSESSAFAPVRSQARSPERCCNAVPEEEEEKKEEEEEISLVKQISVVGEVLSMIISMANVLEKASQLSLQDLTGENCLLRQKVTSLEGEVHRLQQDRSFKNDELTDANCLIEDLKDRIRDMGDKIISLSDYQFQYKRMQQDMEHLIGEVKQLETDKEILNAEVEELTSQLSQRDPDLAKYLHMQGERVALKRKNQQLLLQISEERDRYQELGNKAGRKMKILEGNWKKAESEVMRFDEFVDSIQSILMRNKDFISRNPELHRLLQIIDGEETADQHLPYQLAMSKTPDF